MKTKSLLSSIICVKSILLFFAIAINLTSFSQESEADLKSKAEKTYKAENFVEASKIYSQLLAINKTDAFYNYRYGVCLIYNSRKKQDAIKHLFFASKEENFDPEVFFYLGKAYHLNFEFGEAIKYYNTYKTKAGSKLNPLLDVNRQIEMSENGKRLLSSMNEMVVMEKTEIEASRFFELYVLNNIGGTIIVNAQFQSKIDKKNKHTPVIHFPANPSTIFYSSYGEDEKKGKDIFIRRKLPDGSWSLPQTVNGGVNTQYDEDFPYMHPSGKYLYFCSKGHNSMGGFDVFRSKYDKENNTFGPAENLDFAISSPDDDLFYVVDSLDKNAYFASSRQSLDGKIHVYKVRVAQVPIQLAVIKAGFSSTINPENKKVTVEVYDFVTNAKIGTFNSNEKGNVLMTFPKGGKYEYQIRVNGDDPTYKTIINVPFLTEFKPLKQKMIHEKTESGETVSVVNLFDENVEDPQTTMIEIARVRSELNPNSKQFDLNALDKGSENKEVYAQIGYGKLSDREVVENINKLALIQENQAKNLEELQRKALDVVVDNVKTITNLQVELKTTVALAETKSGDEKKSLIEKAASIVNEINRVDTESKKLISYADSLVKPIRVNQDEAKSVRKLAENINISFEKKDMDLVIQMINDNKKLIQDLQKDKSELASEAIVKELIAKREEIKNLGLKQKEFLDMKIRAKNELLDLDIKLAEAKPKEQSGIQKKVDAKLEEIKMAEDELKTVDSKSAIKKEELLAVEKKLVYLQNIQDSKAPKTNLSAVDVQKSLTESDNQNSRTLKSYVEAQSKTLGIDLAAQKYENKEVNKSTNVAVNKVTLTDSQKEIASQLKPDYNKNMEEIAIDSKLDEEQKMKFTQKEEKYLKFQLSKEINTTEEALKQTPKDEGLKTKLKNLTTLNETLNNNILAIQKDLEKKFPSTNPEKKLTEIQLANRVKPNHFAKLMIIEEDEKLSENQKLDKAQTEDQELVKLLSKENISLQQKFAKDPSDETVKHEMSLIKNLLVETDKRIEKRTMGMASFNVTDTKVQEDYNANKTQENKTSENKTQENKTTENKANPIDLVTIKEVSPTYEKTTNEIKNSTVITQKVKQEKLIVEENKLQTSVDTKLKELDKLILKNPADTSLTNKKENLIAVKQQSEDRENESKQLVQNEVKSSINKEQLLNSVDKTYVKEISPTSTENATKNIAREEKLQENLKVKIAANEKKIAVKEDLNLLAENQVLNELIDDSKTRVEQTKNPALSINETKVNENKTIENKTIENKTIENKEKETKTQEQKEAELKALGIQVENKTSENKTQENKTTENKETPIDFATIKEVSPSYEKNINGIKNNPASTPKAKQEKLILEENKLQTSVDTKLKELDKQLLKNPADTSLTNKKENLLAIKQQSENREKESKILVQNDVKTTIDKKQLLNTVDKTYVKEITPTTTENATQNISREEKLQENLKVKIAANEKKITAKEDLNLLAENQVLNELIDESKSRVEQIKNPSLSVNETKVNENKTSENKTTENKTTENKTTENKTSEAKTNEVQNPVLVELTTKENEILSQLSNPKLAKKEEIRLTKELISNQEKQIEINTKTAENNENLIKQNQQVTSQSVAKIVATSVDKSIYTKDSLSMKLINRNKEEIAVLQKELLEAKKDTKKAEILKEIKQKQNENLSKEADLIYSSQLTKDATSLQALEQKSSSLSLESKESLQRRKGVISVDIAEMTQEIEVLKGKQKVEKDKAKKVRIIKEVEIKEKQVKLLNEELKNIDLELNNKIAEERKNSSPEVIEVAVSEEEKQVLANNSNYSELKEAFVAKKTSFESKQKAYTDLESAKNEYIKLVSEQAKNPSTENQQKVKLAFDEVLAKTKAYQEESKKESENLALYTKLSADEKFLFKLEKMFVEGVESNYKPLAVVESKTNPVSSDFVPFKILEVPQTASVEERVKIGAEMPMGLVYRVQVGAFRKPLKTNLFTEFTPVTGEIIKTGITRYITGYFNSLLNASDAKKAIRKFGYRDAFIVAYCDGKRISIAEAKRLQKSGQCVPSESLGGNPVIAENKTIDSKTQENKTTENKTVESKTTENKSTDSKVSDYNKGKNAVKAIAVETKLGLFYTVQIGAYKTPATSKQLKYIENVVSKKLADGKIRYSTGIFQSISACMETKNMAISKGITDAFVTAYYNGERITLAEAERLLKEKGEGILEKP